MRVWPRQPGPGSSRDEALTYVRNLLLACIPMSALLIALLVAFSAPRWGVIASGALLGLAVIDAVWLTLKLPRSKG